MRRPMWRASAKCGALPMVEKLQDLYATVQILLRGWEGGLRNERMRRVWMGMLGGTLARNVA